jgi:hypothetical protein
VGTLRPDGATRVRQVAVDRRRERAARLRGATLRAIAFVDDSVARQRAAQPALGAKAKRKEGAAVVAWIGSHVSARPGIVGRGWASIGSNGSDWRGGARSGIARRRWKRNGSNGSDVEWRGRQRVEVTVLARNRPARSARIGSAGKERAMKGHFEDWKAVFVSALAGQATEHDMSDGYRAEQVKTNARELVHDRERMRAAGQAANRPDRRGLDRLRIERHGSSGAARARWVRPGFAWKGIARQHRLGTVGVAQHRRDRRGQAWQERSHTESLRAD